MTSVGLRIVVDPSGTVVSATAVDGFANAFAAAEAQAMNWRYRPFTKDGKTIAATFRDVVSVYPPELQIARQIQFPEVTDASRIRIRLTRSACFGACPAYSVDITDDGLVTYDGVASVAVSGRYWGRIPRAAVMELIAEFRRADFFSLQDEYIAPITDTPFYASSLIIDGHGKTVVDYEGLMVGMPEAMVQVESAIDRFAGTEKFVKGTPETIETLRKAGFDFSSPQAGVYLADALEIDSQVYARSLIEAGAPLDGRTTRQQLPFPQLIAAGSPEKDATARLLVETAIARGSYQDRTNAVWLAVGLDDAGLLRRLIAKGADIKTTFADYPWITPLSNARSDSVARVLLSAGLDPSRMKPSPLLVTESEDVALVLAGSGLIGETRTALIARAREKGWTRLLAKLGA